MKTHKTIKVSGEWQSLNSLSGAEVGAEIDVQVIQGRDVRFINSESRPSFESKGFGYSPREFFKSDAGEYECWVVSRLDIDESIIEAKCVGKAPVVDYQNVVVIGASIMNSAFGQDLINSVDDATAYLNVEGVNVYGYCFSGYAINQIIPKIQEAFVAFPSNTLFLIHIGGNNVSSLRPYASASQANIGSFEADFDLLESTIAPRYNDCVVADLTFRNYDGDTLYNQENGSLPLITNHYSPRRNPNFTNVDGRSVLDLYTYVRNNHAVMLSNDYIHLTGMGQTMIMQHMMDRTRYLVTGGAMPEPLADEVPPYVEPEQGASDSIIVDFGSVTGDEFSGVSVGVAEFKTGSVVPLFDVSGNPTSYSLEFTVTDSSDVDKDVSETQNGVNLGGVFANTLMSNPIHKSCLWWSPSDKVHIKVLGLSPLESIEIGFVATRAHSNDRFTEIIDSSNVANKASYATSNAIPDQPAKLVLTENGSGFAEFQVDAQSGTSYTYLSGIQISPLQ
ncbi:SGNH hydrolase-type esterase domain protein [Vibrio phage 1.029.O._10N.261.55.A7]|nr:SGNH hydrolase-type esterase domain protein [Vibrio phage 1.029.O._10N.261.55.A7]